MKSLIIALLVFLECFSDRLHAQNKFTTGKEPAWISLQTIDYTKSNLNKDAEGGNIDIDLEKQVSLADQSVYFRRSIKILSEAGVQDNSQISIDFDPSFQKLVIHTICIIRDGQVLNKLEVGKMKTIHQETDLNRYIYNGTLQAILFLEDVRKNDVIEYSYTLKGFNPIFQNKYSDFYDTRWASPIYYIYYKLIVPGNRTIHIKNNIATITPATHEEAGQTVYEWKLNNVEALRLQDDYPGWLDPYPCVMVSEYANWKEVGAWATSLFPEVHNVSNELQRKINEIMNSSSLPENRTTAALRFVQDDIRYMGLEMGVHSHQPASPDKTFNRRFGDCKEKSYLLATMLQKMGIDALPVLINSSYTKAINTWLPSSKCFDHVTVRVKLNDEYHWFDPTISYQRGSIGHISYPDYKTGLIVTDTSTALTAIANQETGEERVKEIFTVADMSGRAKLKVVTTYTGYYADNTRNDFNSNSNYEMQKSYQQFYQAYFTHIKADSLMYNDEGSKGIFTTIEYYSIDSFWNTDKGEVKRYFEPYVINNVIRKPKEQSRSIPFSIPYPAKYHEEIEINLPEEWSAKPFKESISCAGFTYKANCIVSERKVSIQYDFENLKDNITPDEAADFFTTLKKVDDNQGYELTYGSTNNNNFYSNTYTNQTNPFYVTLPIVLFLGVAVWWTQRRQ